MDYRFKVLYLILCGTSAGQPCLPAAYNNRFNFLHLTSFTNKSMDSSPSEWLSLQVIVSTFYT
jgi:hypothetical protein